MTYEEKRMNLFDVDKSYHLAHCISTDCAMGAGIAVDFQKKFSIKNKLLSYDISARKHPTCIQVDRVFNLITKKVYYGKPTYITIQKALEVMKDLALDDHITKIAMPKIGSGLDQLSWPKVREIIKEVFANTDIEILICVKGR